MIAPSGIVLVTTTQWSSSSNQFNNHLSPPEFDDPSLPTARSATLTLRNCLFNHIEYSRPIISAQNQTVVVENSTFGDYMSVLNYAHSYSCGRFTTESDDNDDNGCAYVMACEGNSSCDIQDSCRSDIDYIPGTGWLYESSQATMQIDEESKECGFS